MESKNILYRVIGFMDYKDELINELLGSGYKEKKYKAETLTFLENSYHSEFTKIMFNSSDDTLRILNLDCNHSLSINKSNSKVKINGIQVYFFKNTHEKTNTSIFSIDLKIEDQSINNISNVTSSLKYQNCEITYENSTFIFNEFISKTFLCGNVFYTNKTSLEQYAGFKFKNYLIIDVEKNNTNKDHLLYELGTGSKIGTINSEDLHSPTEKLMNNVLENKISCYKNYDCLPLLDSFTVVGYDNYNEEDIYTYSTWSEIYFSIYIFNLYIKSSLQVLLNDFSSNPLEKRKEFLEFYNKYFFKKISYNFLPNIIFQDTAKALEIEEDLNFLEKKLETFATQYNEKQQKQQEFLLLIISVLALLETPLHIEGIRTIIGIDNFFIYNSFVYPILVITVVALLISKRRKK